MAAEVVAHPGSPMISRIDAPSNPRSGKAAKAASRIIARVRSASAPGRRPTRLLVALATRRMYSMFCDS